MDKFLGKAIQKTVGEGEKKAPLKSVKLKVKFQKVDDKKKAIAKKMAK